MINQLNKLPNSKEEIGFQYALIYASIEEWDTAFKNFENATLIQDSNMLYGESFMPEWYREMKDDPRMKQLIKRIDAKIK